MKPPLSYAPLVPILPAFILGILLYYSSIPLLFAILPCIIAGICYFKKQHFVAICLLLISLGWINSWIQKPHTINSNLIGKELTFIATVLSDKESETMQHLAVEIKSIYNNSHPINSTPFKCNVTIPSSHPDFNPGDIIRFNSTIEDINQEHNLPNQWDMSSYLTHQGIVATTFVEVENISIIGHEDNLYWNIRRLRLHITHLILNSQLNENTSVFINAILTGDTSFLSKDTRISYSEAGLAHILALSGMHIAIIAMVLSILLFPLYILKMNKYRHLLTILLLWAYAILTGLSPSATRAVIMTTVYLIGLIMQRRHSSINALCFAALLILFFDPQSLFSISFQLSFVAVASILIFAEKINPFNRRYHPFIYYVASIASVSLAATIGTGLIAAYYFHIFPTYFIFSNIVVTMLLPILMCFSIILIMLIHFFDFSSVILCKFIDTIYNYIEMTASYCNLLPFNIIQNIYISPWLFIPIFASIISFALLLYLKRKVYLISTFLLVAFTISIHYITKPTYNNIEYFIPQETEHTSIIIRDKNNIFISTTAEPKIHVQLTDKYKFVFRDYFATREIDSISVILPDFNSKNIQQYKNYTIIGNDIFYIVAENILLYDKSLKVKYLLICKGFSDDIVTLYNTIKPDTVLLSNDLHIKRHNKYVDSCKTHNISFISLRDTPFYNLSE